MIRTQVDIIADAEISLAMSILRRQSVLQPSFTDSNLQKSSRSERLATTSAAMALLHWKMTIRYQQLSHCCRDLP